MKRLMLATTLILAILGTPAVTRPDSNPSKIEPDNKPGEIQKDKRKELPKGNWSLGHGPTEEPNPDVDVYRVTANAAQGLTITKVEIRNLSGRPVSAIKLGWRLFLESSPDVILLQGETPLLTVSLLPRHRRSVKYPVVCFADIWKNIANGDQLNGNYIIEVSVAEVVFDTTSSLNPESGAKSYRLKLVKLQDDDGGICDTGDCSASGPCQHQTCYYHVNCYRCNFSPRRTCSWIDCDGCTNGRCS